MGLKLASPWPRVVSVLHYLRVRPSSPFWGELYISNSTTGICLSPLTTSLSFCFVLALTAKTEKVQQSIATWQMVRTRRNHSTSFAYIHTRQTLFISYFQLYSHNVVSYIRLAAQHSRQCKFKVNDDKKRTIRRPKNGQQANRRERRTRTTILYRRGRL